MRNGQTIQDLRAAFGDRVSQSQADLSIHSQSESYFAPLPPDAVVYPETTDHVSQIMRICSAQNCPVVPWGTGTSLEGHSLALHGGICLDFSRMDKILQINDADMDVVVQPGLTREALNIALRHTGLFFPVDPGANAALGGMAGTRASGTTSVMYGTMRNNVMALEVVLADGQVIRTGSRARKSAAGYDLTGLFVGSEGTLGLITELTLKLYGQPEAISSAVCAFDSVAPAVDTVIAATQSGMRLARVELVDAATVEACNAYAGTSYDPLPHLLVEIHGSTTSVAQEAEAFGELVSDMGGHHFKWSAQTEERTALWTLRHNAYYAVLATRKGARAVVTDLCVPISNLTEAIEETREDVEASILTGPILGHVGDGNFHVILLIDPTNPTEEAEAKRLSHRMVHRALSLGGTVTGEHGVGFGKLGFMEAEHGRAWDVMAGLKKQLDPTNILNPGKVVRLGN
ncbi:MAG: FAD-linked oxidase C-terminal domain-containing protein [Pseudomonadota bacterium]